MERRGEEGRGVERRGERRGGELVERRVEKRGGRERRRGEWGDERGEGGGTASPIRSVHYCIY